MQLLSIMDPERLYGNFDLLAKVETLGLPTFPSASDNVNFYLYLYGAVCESTSIAIRREEADLTAHLLQVS